MRMKRSTVGLALGAVLIILAGCADDPVTTPDGQPLVFSGLLEEGGSVTESLVLVEEGMVRIELSEATAVLIELPPGGGEIPPVSLGIGLGSPGSSSGSCSLTFGDSLSEGDALLVLMGATEKCLLIFDDGSLPDDAVVSYTVTVDDVKS